METSFKDEQKLEHQKVSKSGFGQNFLQNFLVLTRFQLQIFDFLAVANAVNSRRTLVLLIYDRICIAVAAAAAGSMTVAI